MTITLSRIISISEYFMPRTSTGMRASMWGESTSLQIGCSARDNQNSQASRETPSSGSWVLTSMYWKTKQLLVYLQIAKKIFNIPKIGNCIRQYEYMELTELALPLLLSSCVQKNIFVLHSSDNSWWHMIIRSLSTTPTCITWTMWLICGMRRSIRTSTSMTRALHTFLRTSGSSSDAK